MGVGLIAFEMTLGDACCRNASQFKKCCSDYLDLVC